ncbi:flagellar protein FlgN [Ferrovibrio terrae]|uniref:Flagellar protein FlgN n=1 Tax=Ferrovibrio terrae TaxID=2594003 RepID=A0A516H0Z7_9PROT|nr:flagellar protein FlgN [Ferrovibrio terrae]QDO97438.1 flagellar protein FlgN [Ferrovibrio terrae]
MNSGLPDFPAAAPATDLAGLIALGLVFTTVVRAETDALRKGERSSFEALTARKGEYFDCLKQSLAALELHRAKANAADRARWQEVAAECEAALQENAKLIAGEQLHAAAMMDMLRQQARQRQTGAVGYGRDGRLKPRI